MAELKSDVKDRKMGSQFVIRVDKVERDAFVTLCGRLDTSAAREIRRFMREFVAAREAVAKRSGAGSVPAGARKTVVTAAKVVAQSTESAASQEPGVGAEAPAGDAETPGKKQARVHP